MSAIKNIFENRIKKDETVLFFPTAASIDPDENAWLIEIDAWIFEPEENSRFREKIMNLFRDFIEAPDVENTIFKQRAGIFLVDSEGGKRLKIRIGDTVFELQGKSDGDGRLRATLKIPARLLSDDTDWITFQTVLPNDDKRVMEGRARLLAEEGISVISDVDDTIKISDVTNADRKILLRNTFVEQYREVPGMAQAYRNWADDGASFHYLSGSPRGLLPALGEFLGNEGFPAGTLALRHFSFDPDDFMKFLSEPIREFKEPRIEEMLRRFPKRKFILVGDSGEADAEIYADIYCRRPEQILHIFIRGIEDHGVDVGKLQSRCGRDLSNTLTVFEDASELMKFDIRAAKD